LRGEQHNCFPRSISSNHNKEARSRLVETMLVVSMNDICLFVSTEEFDPVSILIREKTECDWSHVGFYRLSDNMTFSAMCDGKGVAWRAVEKQQKIMLLDVSPEYNVAAAFAKPLTQEGKAYNELDILGIALGRNWTTADRFICSTLVLWAFQQAGYPLLNMRFLPLDHLTPRDVLLSGSVSQRTS
jgi:hypothetical protein